MQQSSLSVVADVAGRLRRDIALGLLRPGHKLNIEALKRDWGVSHPSIREALALLQGEGYVQSEGQKGFRVLENSQEEQADIARVRAELEVVAVGWSVERSTRQWRAQVVASHYALTEIEALLPADPVAHVMEWDDLNRDFHLTLAGNCGSDRLLQLLARQYDLTRRYRLMAHAAATPEGIRGTWVQGSAQEHTALKDAVLAGETATAQSLLRAHIGKASVAANAKSRLDNPNSM